MGFRVKPDGTIEADSLEDAIQLSQRLTNGVGAAPASAKGHSKAPPAASTDAGAEDAAKPAWGTFVALVRDKETQMRVLNAIKAHGEIGLDDLCKEIGAASNLAISGTMAGLVKNAKRAKVNFLSIIKRETSGYGPNKKITYKAGRLLRESADFR